MATKKSEQSSKILQGAGKAEFGYVRVSERGGRQAGGLLEMLWMGTNLKRGQWGSCECSACWSSDTHTRGWNDRRLGCCPCCDRPSFLCKPCWGAAALLCAGSGVPAVPLTLISFYV